MRCDSVGLVMAVMVSMLTNEVRGFEHLKHKFKLKKLAKLAFAAKLLVPHLIPLPIPLPLIERNRNKHTFKVIEETDPWSGQGWEMPEGWDFSTGQGGWNFEGGNGWQQMQGWKNQMTFPESWNPQQGFDGHFQKNSFQQQNSIPSLKGEELGSGGQHSHQVEFREEIVPALRAAGFSGDPNGVMTKMHRESHSMISNPWAGAPHSEESQFGSRPRSRIPANHGWSIPERTQVADVLKVKEIRDATIVHRPPFDVQNGKLGHFDVSSVPVQSIRAPKQTAQIDPWPQNVADSPEHDAAVKHHFETDQESDTIHERPGGGGGAAGHGTGLEDVVPEDKLIWTQAESSGHKEERHQAQDSEAHANVSPDIPHTLSLQQFQNEQGWLPMVTSIRQEALPSPRTRPVERDAHKKS